MPSRTALRALKDENSRLLREDLARRSTTLRALPEVVTLNHTDLCNLRCIMCPRHLAQGKHRLSQRVLGYLAAELFPTARKLVLTTSGGEPLAADFEFLLEHALRDEVPMDVVTNGVLLAPSLYHHARPALDHLNVSLDSHLPAVYEKIRLGAKFERVLANLEGIADLRRREPDGVLYSTSAVVMRSNLPHLADFVRFAADHGFEAVVLQRLLHSVKPTPDEEPQTHLDAATLARSMADVEAAALERGINLYRTEFGLPPVLARDLRAKRPDLLLSQGLCWFMAQNFGVMYTGEVYPCCIPTDHLLGNVLYEEPVEIWNGKRAQALRAAQWSGRGTLFCSGCLHAPHLPARPLGAANAALKVARRAARHALGRVTRRLLAEFATPLIAPPLPSMIAHERAFERRDGAVRITNAAHLRNDVATIAPHDGSIWLVRDGALLRSASEHEEPSQVTTFRESFRGQAIAPRATALRFATRDVLFVAFEGGGELLRVRLGNELVIERALELSDPRAFVRHPALQIAPSGAIYAGEYGVHPGARCGRLHRASDANSRFEEVARLDWARHIHAVLVRDDGGALFTTGDLAARRRLLAIGPRSRAPRTIERAWSGFTAIAQTPRHLHFGTDLREGNGLLRRDHALTGPAEFRRLPDDLDLQVRQFAVLPDDRIAALLSMDADLGERRAGRRAALLLSSDDGASWARVHEFCASWSDVPEGLAVLPTAEGAAARLLTLWSEVPAILELPPVEETSRTTASLPLTRQRVAAHGAPP
jgi:MoaA/NifB/PqqE/SkfB family radical SAM enzyme